MGVRVVHLTMWGFLQQYAGEALLRSCRVETHVRMSSVFQSRCSILACGYHTMPRAQGWHMGCVLRPVHSTSSVECLSHHWIYPKRDNLVLLWHRTGSSWARRRRASRRW